MSKTYKHQATYDYLHKNKEVKGKLLKGIKKFFMNVNFPKWDGSRISWYKHKNRYDNEKDIEIQKEVFLVPFQNY